MTTTQRTTIVRRSAGVSLLVVEITRLRGGLLRLEGFGGVFAEALLPGAFLRRTSLSLPPFLPILLSPSSSSPFQSLAWVSRAGAKGRSRRKEPEKRPRARRRPGLGAVHAAPQTRTDRFPVVSRFLPPPPPARDSLHSSIIARPTYASRRHGLRSLVGVAKLLTIAPTSGVSSVTSLGLSGSLNLPRREPLLTIRERGRVIFLREEKEGRKCCDARPPRRQRRELRVTLERVEIDEEGSPPETSSSLALISSNPQSVLGPP